MKPSRAFYMISAAFMTGAATLQFVPLLGGAGIFLLGAIIFDLNGY